MSEKILVSKQGNNALTDTNQNDFIFHSDYNTFKILYQGLGTINVNADSVFFSIPHNAPVTPPLLSVFGKFPDGKTCSLDFQTIYSHMDMAGVGAAPVISSIYWDNTNIYLYSVTRAGSPSYPLVVSWFAYEPQL